MPSLHQKRILVTSGPKFAALDAVRSVTNHSTGRLGATIAVECARQGGDVVLLAGESSKTPRDLFWQETFPALSIEPFRTVAQLKERMESHLKTGSVDVLVMAAAVLDYLPEAIEPGKKGSDADEWTVTFKRGEKLIEQVRRWSPGTLLVGFKLESGIAEEALRQRCVDLMRRSGARLVVANRLEEVRDERHVARIYENGGDGTISWQSDALQTRDAIAKALVDKVGELIGCRG